MKISNKFFEVGLSGVGATIRVQSTGAVLTLTRDELRELFRLLGPIYEDDLPINRVSAERSRDAEIARHKDDLSQALRQWRMYAEMDEVDLEHDNTEEARLYRALIANASK